jgi:hypothetical protein
MSWLNRATRWEAAERYGPQLKERGHSEDKPICLRAPALRASPGTSQTLSRHILKSLGPPPYCCAAAVRREGAAPPLKRQIQTFWGIGRAAPIVAPMAHQ